MTLRPYDVLKKLKTKVLNWDEKQLIQLDKIANTPRGKSLIPVEVADEPPQEGLEDRKFILKFEYFQEDVSLLQSIDVVKLKAIIKKFHTITALDVSGLQSSGLIRCTLNKKDRQHKEYIPLFDRMPEDVENLHETELPGGGRIFFFYASEFFYIFAIDTIHRNLN